MSHKEIWIVIDFEGSLIFTGSYEEAKEIYDNEVMLTISDLTGYDAGFSEDELGLRVILAKVDKALNFFFEEKCTGRTTWNFEDI